VARRFLTRLLGLGVRHGGIPLAKFNVADYATYATLVKDPKKMQILALRCQPLSWMMPGVDN
jgi:hypothetical protein